jgi:hypothetical protein
MKTCECGNIIYNRIKVDGKIHMTSNRTHCLECVPFNSRIRFKTNGDRKKHKQIQARNYYKKFREKYGVDLMFRKRRARKLMVLNLVGYCQGCGYNRCTRNISFHHLENKQMNMDARGFQYGYKKSIGELKKCVAVCHNCHGEIHDGMTDNDKVLEYNKILNDKLNLISEKNWANPPGFNKEK